jgi:hypothetical protein
VGTTARPALVFGDQFPAEWAMTSLALLDPNAMQYADAINPAPGAVLRLSGYDPITEQLAGKLTASTSLSAAYQCGVSPPEMK